MPTYEFKAKDREGQIREGFLTAPGEEELREAIGGRGLYLISYGETRRKEARAARPRVRVKGKDLAFLCWQLYTGLDAGVPIARCLDIVSKDVRDEELGKVLRSVRKDLEEGLAFSDALKSYPHVFSKMFVGLVRAGEAASDLPKMLYRLAQYLDKLHERRSRFTGAMAYPAVLAIISAVVVTFLLIFVTPRFADIFQRIGAELPLATRILMGTGTFLKANWYYVLGGVVAAVAGVRGVLATRAGRIAWDRRKLRIPFFGPTMHKVLISRFGDTLSTLVNGGVPVLRSLEIVSEAAGNEALTVALDGAIQEIKKGKPIHETLATTGLFPDLMVRMISVGEETGQLGDMMEKVGLFLDREVEQAIKTFSKIIEPLMLVIMTVVIGGIAVAIFLPLAEISTKIK